MIDASQMDWMGVLGFTFVPTLLCGALIRARGILGWVVLVAIGAVFVFVFADLEGGFMTLGLFSAMLGLFVGGKISDIVDRKRIEKKTEEDNFRRKHGRFLHK